MTSIRIMHLADVHIGMENYGRLDPATGLNGRVMDFLRRLSEAVEYALDNEVDLVLFAGDAYKTRDPNSTYRREFARRIKRLADRQYLAHTCPFRSLRWSGGGCRWLPTSSSSGASS